MNWTLLLGAFVALSGLCYVGSFALLHWLDDDGAVTATRKMYDAAGLRVVVLAPFAVWLTVLMVLAAPTPAGSAITHGDSE